MIQNISIFIMPTIIFLILTNAVIKKAPVFDLFTKGAKEGVSTSLNILPALLGLIVAVSMLRASGFFEILSNIISPLTEFIGFPSQLVPMAVIRPISGSASLATLQDILNTNGADSFAGRCASVMMGSSETTFYTLAVYFGSVGITKTRYTLKAALIADFATIILSILWVNILFN